MNFHGKDIKIFTGSSNVNVAKGIAGSLGAVSYTHLDVYKRQNSDSTIESYYPNNAYHPKLIDMGKEWNGYRLDVYKRQGDYISIDGSTGNIYEGVIPTVDATIAVSYTHLDVYKRQVLNLSFLHG